MSRATQYQYYRYCISVVALTKDPRVSEDKDIKANAIIKSLAKDGVNGELAYLKGKYKDLKEFNPEVVFMLYPYECIRCDTYNSKYVAQFATIFYINYGFTFSNFEILQYENDFLILVLACTQSLMVNLKII